MAEFRVINVNVGVFDKNDRVADANRAKLRAQKTFMLNVMASPGAGKTTTLLATIAALKDKYKIGVMEADIDATVDAETMANAGVRSIQVHTGGECAMDAEMTRQALEEFPTEDLDLLFLENIGNLVCPAEFDTGAALNMTILSVPEGDDKPAKYPLMYEVADLLVVNKIDALAVFDFDKERMERDVLTRNPDMKIFYISALTGEGVEELASYLIEKTKEWNA